MTIKKKTIVKCPYCPNQFKITLYSDDNLLSREIVCCPSDESENGTEGCDRYFVVEFQAKVVITEIYKMVELVGTKGQSTSYGH